MAKEEEFKYGSFSVPNGEAKYQVIRWGWKGLNRTDRIDTGQLTDSSGVMVDPPYTYPQKDVHEWPGMDYAEPISIHGFDDRLLVVYRDDGKIKADYCRYHDGQTDKKTYVISDANGNMSDFSARTAVQFNAVDTSSGSVPSYTYDRKILIFPDAYSIPFDFDSTGSGGHFRTSENPVPGIQYGTVYGSRVFGVDENNVYASVYNNYADWSLDTADSSSSDNAWMSMSQSNSKADGSFTAIATYDNHPVLFKKDFLQLVYNNRNPFRIVDVGSYGADSQNAVAEMGGVLYFASQDKLYGFTGGTPKDVGKKLEIDNFSGAALGSFKDTLYMYVDGNLYAYSAGVWSCLGPVISGGDTVNIKQFATLDYGMCALTDDGNGGKSISFITWSDDALEELTGDVWDDSYTGDWWFETDIFALGRLDIRRVKKLSLLCTGAPGAEVSAYILRDGEVFNAADAEKSGEIQFPDDADGNQQRIMRVLTRQHSGYMHRLRIAGRGWVRIEAAEIKISWGGDVYVEG